MGSIVVGVDGSENSRHALAWAVHEAQLRQAHLDIVSCWEYPMLIASEVMWAPPPDRNSLMAAAATRANTFIEQLQLDETDLSFDVLTPEGRPGAELVRIASDTDAEMLVVGSRGQGSAVELLLGSVSNYCAHHSRCPITIIRPKPSHHA